MEIISWQFGLFTIAVLSVYYLLPQSKQKTWLLVASYAFYLTYPWWFVGILLAVTLVTYFVARQIDIDRLSQTRWVWLGIAFNVGMLVSLKLTNSEYILHLSRLISAPLSTRVILPIGVAFYTLQAISYLVDVYNRRISAASSLVDFALYISYFPKLISGPIERARSFLSQLQRRRNVTNEVLTQSFTLILIGLFRKIVIADILPRMFYKDLVWSGSSSEIRSPELFLWLMVFSFTLYNDFAGYTSIVRGISGLFGITLSQNFQQPFFARNFSEFWSRWHMSFTYWLRDYIYYPVSRWLLRRSAGKRNIVNILLPPLLTMALSGLWHAFALHTLLWGLMHGFYLAVEGMWGVWRPSSPMAEQSKIRQIASALITFFLVTFAWAPFAINITTGKAGALAFWQALLLSNFTLSSGWFLAVLVPFSISLWLDWMQYKAKDETFFLRWSRPAQAFTIALVFLMLFAFGTINQGSVFVYQGF